MTFPIRSSGAFAVLWLVALAATAAPGQIQAQPDPADASAPVPPTRYAPMPMPIPHARPVAPASPAENWKALNKSVATYDSMSLTMGSMQMAAPVAPAGDNAAAPAPPAMAQAAPTFAQPPAQSPAPAAHSHHVHKESK